VWGDREHFGGGLPVASALSEESGRLREDVPFNVVDVHLVANFSNWNGDLHVGPFKWNGEEARDEQQVTFTGDARTGSHEVNLRGVPGEWEAAWRATPLYGSGTLQFRVTVEECAPAEDGDAS
jgi:hypothetical protein